MTTAGSAEPRLDKYAGLNARIKAQREAVPDCWLSTIAMSMTRAAEVAGDTSLAMLAEVLMGTAKEHRSLVFQDDDGAPMTMWGGKVSGQCDTCDDVSGSRRNWPCGEWWRAFHTALDWAIGRVDFCIEDHAHSGGQLPAAGDGDTKRALAAERQRRSRARRGRDAVAARQARAGQAVSTVDTTGMYDPESGVYDAGPGTGA